MQQRLVPPPQTCSTGPLRRQQMGSSSSGGTSIFGLSGALGSEGEGRVGAWTLGTSGACGSCGSLNSGGCGTSGNAMSWQPRGPPTRTTAITGTQRATRWRTSFTIPLGRRGIFWPRSDSSWNHLSHERGRVARFRLRFEEQRRWLGCAVWIARGQQRCHGMRRDFVVSC